MNEDNATFPVFKGLQKPLELMGIRGRFLIYAAIIALSTILSFFILSAAVGKGTAAIVAISILGGGYAFIRLRQKEGLHSKKRFTGMVIYRNPIQHHL